MAEADTAHADPYGLEDRHMGGLYQRFPITIERGEGALVWDINGKEYIDCMGGYGVALVGHCNPRVVRAIKRQAGKIITAHSSTYNTTRQDFIRSLMDASPKGLDVVHLNNSGAESIEAAIKFARRHTNKKRMVAMRGSYHGKSMGALSITFSPKYRKPFAPLVEEVQFVPFGDAAALEESVDGDTAAVILEPVQGESGIHVAPDGFLQRARTICDNAGAVLVFDEIQCGLGRTGMMWASEHWNTIPDIMCLAKGIAGGVPMGVTLARQDIIRSMKKGEHSSTFGGNPLACAAGSAALESIKQDRLAQAAGEAGKILFAELRGLQKKHSIIREIRGMGLMVGMEIKTEVRDILLDGIKNGLLLLYSGRNIIRMLPPLVITPEQISKTIHTLDMILSNEEARHG